MRTSIIKQTATLIVFLASFVFLAIGLKTSAYASDWQSDGLGSYQVAKVAVDPSDARVLYAGTNAGIFKSTDAGANWTAVNNGISIVSGANFATVVIDPNNPNTVYVAEEANQLYKTTNGGSSWTAVSGGLPALTMDIVVDPTNSNIVYSAQYAFCTPFWKSTDGGTTWNSVNVPGLGFDGCQGYRLIMDPQNHNTLYLGDDSGGHVFKSTDAGATWTEALGPGGGFPGAVRGLAIDAVNSNVLYTGTENQGVDRSTDAGANFSHLPQSPSAVIGRSLTADPLQANLVYAGGNGGAIFRSTDQGNTWQVFGLSAVGNVYGITIPNNAPTLIYAGTDAGVYVYGQNQAPVVSFAGSTTINEGDTYTGSGSFTDPDSTSWSATVDYGDGSGSQPLTLSGQNFSLNHVYKDNGTYTVSVSVTDDGGGTGTQTATVTVNNVAPTVGTVTVTPSPAHVNSTVNVNAAFSDPGTLDTHTATIDWGDGSSASNGTVTETNGSGTVAGTHTYTTFGTYTITVTVKDKDNATGQKTASVTVVKQLTALDPATIYISKGIVDLTNTFDVKAQVYKDSTLVTSGELDNINPGTSATAETIPFNSFSAIDFPAGSQLKIAVSACSASGLLTGTATLHYNASTVDSKFGATIGTTDTIYHLFAGNVLGTSAGTSAKTVAVKSNCTTFTSFGTWTVTP